MKLPFQLQDGEQVVEVVRRHWLHIYPRLIGQVLLAVVPIIALWYVVLTRVTVSDQVRLALYGITAVWLVAWAVRIFFIAYAYNNDLWTLTNQRIIDSVRPNPFSLRIESADLVNVQNIGVSRTGLFRTIFNFGDVECETASETGKFTLTGVAKPADVQLLIDRLRDAQRSRSNV